MTAQISDAFVYQGQEYSLAGISEGELFDPATLGIEPVGTCTACYRGYQAAVGLLGNKLVIRDFHVNLCDLSDEKMRPQVGPVINGVSPVGEKEEHDWFNNHYEGLNLPLNYTGGLLLARGFIEDLYVHMGFHPAWKFKEVVELIFEDGLLLSESDRSQRAAELREDYLGWRARQLEHWAGKAIPPPTEDEAAEFIERAFDRRYDRF